MRRREDNSNKMCKTALVHQNTAQIWNSNAQHGLRVYYTNVGNSILSKYDELHTMWCDCFEWDKTKLWMRSNQVLWTWDNPPGLTRSLNQASRMTYNNQDLKGIKPCIWMRYTQDIEWYITIAMNDIYTKLWYDIYTIAMSGIKPSSKWDNYQFFNEIKPSFDYANQITKHWMG